VAYELRGYLCKILDKQHVDESTLGIIYCAPEGFEDDWTNPKVWEAANPGYGVTVMPEIIAQLAEKARVTPSAINNLKVKHLCLWVSADQAWMDMTKWREMRDETLKIDDFRGEPCYLGLDLATVSDICAKAYIFMKLIDGKQHYYLFCTSYLPENALAFGSNSQYKGWEHEGLLTVTQGDVTDFSEIEADLLRDKADYVVRGVGYDPWGALQLAQRMTAEGINMVEVPMRVKNVSQPMKELDSLIRQGRLHHNNPILDWCIGNVSVLPDRNDNIFFRKMKPENKIDLAVASVLALALAMEYGLLPKRSIYEDRGAVSLSQY
jgi:phage terminase large subunit-like protein